MTNRIQQFGQWLSKKRSFRMTWFAKDSQIPPDTEEALTQLPDDMVERLMAVVEDLPVHPHEQKSVLAVVEDAIAHWQARPHAAANSIVVLGDPVSSIPRILTDSLGQLDVDHSQPPLSVKLLDWIERPADVKTIEQQLKETLGFTEQPTAKADQSASNSSSSASPQTLLIIPNLCWCFLRSADGLDGLDCLQDLLLSDRNQFWVLGSSIVGWEYLKHTLKLNAYCGDTTLLPKLSGEDLQHWLNPIVEEFNICFPDAALHKRLRNPDTLTDIDLTIDKPIEALSEISQEVSATVQSSARAVKDIVAQPGEDDSDDTPRLDYFNRLADISDGVGIVALQLFIKSLRYQPMDEKTSSADNDAGSDKNASSDSPENTSKQSVSNAENRRLVTTIPKRPPLPSLSQSDMYLLYSLLLHSDMTIDALAKSLGDSSQIVNNQVQVLRNAGVIEQRENIIKINPEHYPELRRKLARNNFIIEIP